MALSPLFSPSDTHYFLESSRRDPSLPTAPLFLHVACSVQASGCDGGEKEGESLPEQPPQIPVCLSESNVSLARLDPLSRTRKNYVSLYFPRPRNFTPAFIPFFSSVESILASDNSPTPPASSASYSVSLSLSFFSFSPDTVTHSPTRTTPDER